LRNSLDRELELLALEDLGVVHVEEVAVQDGLNNTGNNGDGVDLVVCLGKVSVDPVRDVKSAVATEGEEVVGGDSLGLTSSLKHEELRKDSHRLEPDGEGPQNLRKGVVVREDDGEDSSSSEEVLDAESVDIRIVGRLVGVGHEVDNVTLRTKEEDLEDEVVDAIGREKIEIAGNIDKHVESLRLERDTRAAVKLHHLVKQDEDGAEMRKIRGDSEDVQRHDGGGATVVAKLSKIRKWKEVKDSR
jgi:hypothetical protein